MRTMKLKHWEEPKPNGAPGETTEVNLLNAITFLMASKRPEEMPKGLDNFRLMNRIGKAFDKATKSETLKLEDTDYLFLKGILEKDIPSSWANVPVLFEQVEEFLELKQED